MTEHDFDPPTLRASPGRAAVAAADRHLRRRLDRRRRASARPIAKAGFPLPASTIPTRPRRASSPPAWDVARLCARSRRPLAVEGAIFDLATPPARMPPCSSALPERPVALIQKPMGSDLAEATEILEVCREEAARRGGQFPAALRADDAGAAGRRSTRAGSARSSISTPGWRCRRRGICGRS